MIVKCEMCEDLYDLENWIRSDLFICKICVEILSKLKKRQCSKRKREFPKGYWLFEFDYMRQLKREEMSKK